MSPHHTKPSEAGFTLLEMLLALTVIALVASASTVALSGRVAALRASGGIDNVSATVRQARLKALTAGTDVSLIFDLSNGTMTLRPDGAPVRIPDMLRMSVEVDRAQAATDKATIIFYPDGSSSGARILLSADKRNYRIDVDWLTGLVTQERLADAA